MLSRLRCVQLCDTMHCSPPGSSIHGILQAKVLEWVAFSRGSSRPGIEPPFLMSPALAGGFFTTTATWEAWIMKGEPSNYSVKICMFP